MNNNNRIEVKLQNGDKLVAEACPSGEFKEIFVYLESADGKFAQDMAMVGAEYDNVNSVINDKYRVLVWGNEDDEDYTEEFHIEKFQCDED